MREGICDSQACNKEQDREGLGPQFLSGRAACPKGDRQEQQGDDQPAQDQPPELRPREGFCSRLASGAIVAKPTTSRWRRGRC